MDARPPVHQDERPSTNRRQPAGGRRTSDGARARLAAVVDCADEAILVVSLDGEVETCNRAAERLFGYSAKEIVGQPLFLLVPPGLADEERSFLDQARRGKTVRDHEAVRVRKDGASLSIMLAVFPIRNTQEQVVAIAEITREVRESRRAGQRLPESGAGYRQLFESNRDGIVACDLHGRLTDANRAAIEMLGYTLEELRQLTYEQLTPPRWLEMENAIMRDQVLPRGYSEAYEKEYVRKDGSIVPVSVSALLRKDRNDAPTGMWFVARDITYRKRVEDGLRQNQARWRTLFENAPVPIWEEDFSAVRARFDELKAQGVTDLGAYLEQHPEETRHLAASVRIIDMSHATLETFNVSSLEDLSHSLADYFDTDSLNIFRNEMTTLWSGARYFAAEIPIHDVAGQPRLLDVRLSVVPGFEQSLARVLVSFVDVTERRRTEAALRESEERFRCLAEGIPHILWETDPSGIVLYQNRGWHDYVGRGSESALAMSWLEEFHPEDRERVLAQWTQSVRTEGAAICDIEARLRRHDGAYHWFRVRGAPIRNSADKVARWVVICSDIDDQKRAAERIEFAQKAGKVGFYDYDFAARRLVWTEGLAALFGIDMEDTWDGWEKRVVLEDAAAITAKVHECIQMHTDQVVGEFRAILPDGTRRWIGSRGRILYDAAGKPVRLTGMSVDISQRKQMEKELEERARQLAAADRRKDEFLATLAHELRNPLAPIRTSVEIIRLKGGDNPQLQWAADTIDRQVQHLHHLVSDLLDLARVTQGKVSLTVEACDPTQLIRRAIEMNRHGIVAKHQRLRLDLPKEALPLQGDASRLVQVFSNLINNSVKYTPEGGAIHVIAEREKETLAVHVRDTGIGIKPELLPFVFDLFVQGERAPARAEGGLGIGLTLVKRITELHGGSVSVASGGTDQGADFTVRLPLAAAGVRGVPGHAETKPHPHADAPKRVLLVEDNRDAADSLAILLDNLGHDVHVVYDGREGLSKALEILPDVAILDIGLPGLNGYELARRLRREPSLKDMLLIALSGYGQQSDIEEGRSAGFDHHLVKPFDIRELNAILSRTTQAPAL